MVPLWKSLVFPYQVKHILIIQPDNLTPTYLPRRTEGICPYKSLYTYVHTHCICVNPILVIAQISINSEMDKGIWNIQQHTM